MAGSVSMYRLTNAVMVVVCRGTRGKLELLNAGSIIIPTSAADSAGMIEATCEGLPVIIFARDLEERSIEICTNGTVLQWKRPVGSPRGQGVCRGD